MGQGTLSGRCLCGAVRFEASPKKAAMDACHCGMCRRWSAGPFMAVSTGAISVEGEADLAVYASSDWAERGFCRRCGANLFWRLRADPEHVAVAAYAFDDDPGFPFTEEVCIDAKPATYAFAGDRKRMTEAEIMAQFEGSAG